MMWVDSRIRIPFAEIDRVDLDTDAIKALCTYKNPAYEEAVLRAKASRWFRKGSITIPKHIWTWRLEDDCLTLPRGLLRDQKFWKAIERLARGGSYTSWTKYFDDRRCRGDEEAAKEVRLLLNEYERSAPWKPFDYQQAMIVAGLRDETGIWNAPPGAGKTESALLFGLKTGLPTLFLSPNSKVLEEWQRRCYERLGYEPGLIQGDKRNPKPITVGMVQTIVNCAEDYADYFGTVVLDEAQSSGSDTVSYVLDYMPAKYRIGITADERRADGKEDIIYDVFGGVSHRVDRQLLVDRGFILDIEIRVVPTEFRADWYSKLPNEQKKLSANRLFREMYEDEERNALVMKIIEEECRGYRTMVLSLRKEHCRMLDSEATGRKFRSGLFLGGAKDKKEFDSCYARMQKGELDIAFGTYQAVGVGFNIKSLERGVFVLPRANSKKAEMQFNQFLGRYERVSIETGKSRPYGYYLWDQHVYSDRVIKNLMKWRSRVTVWHDGEWISAKEFLSATNRKTHSEGEESPVKSTFGAKRVSKRPAAVQRWNRRRLSSSKR